MKKLSKLKLIIFSKILKQNIEIKILGKKF